MSTTARDEATWGAQLRAAGLRVTGGRVAVMEYLAEHPHQSAAEIQNALMREGIDLSTQSLHNIVRDLTEKGLLHRIDPPGSDAVRYELHTHDHHHLVCTECGRVLDVDAAAAPAPQLDETLAQGMRILETSVTYLGICAECQSRQATPTNPSIAPSIEQSTKEKE